MVSLQTEDKGNSRISNQIERTARRRKEKARRTDAESVPWADRWTESYSGSEDGHPRDVENTGRNVATESRDRLQRKINQEVEG